MDLLKKIAMPIIENLFQIQNRVSPEVVRCIAARRLREHCGRLRVQLQLVGARVHKVPRSNPRKPQRKQENRLHRHPEQV